MPSNPPVQFGERGASLLDALVGIAIISLGIFFSASLFRSHTEIQARLATASQYNEYEHALRNGAAKFMQAWQERLFETRQCGSAATFFNQEAQKLAGGVLKLGVPPTPGLAQLRLGPGWQSRTGSIYRQAIDRCAQSTLGASGGTLAGRSTVYFCATIESETRKSALDSTGKTDGSLAFAEFRVNFWDFGRNVALKCEDFKGLPGRGSVVQYSLYIIDRNNGVADKSGQLPARRHAGRLYVPRS
jgi:hypothetical protein